MYKSHSLKGRGSRFYKKKMKTTITRFLNKLYRIFSYNDYKLEYRKKLTMPSYLDQVLIGLLLSDGSLEKSSKTSLARLSVMFGSLHISYLYHLYNLFEPYCDNLVTFVDTYNNNTNTNYEQVSFKTVSLPLFLKYHVMFYIFDETLNRYKKNCTRKYRKSNDTCCLSTFNYG
jgi:LAGLIDADG DNA endonuclease family